MAENENVRIVSDDAVILRAIRNRENLMVQRGPLRIRTLDFGIAVAENLRSFDYWVGQATGLLGGRIIGRLIP